jgi:CHAT domain-containing protein
VWWCVTGPLAFLPIHAAGLYDQNAVDEELGNYVISSYTPTLSALLQPSQSLVNSSFKLLSVIQPSAPGASSIPNTKVELDYLRRHLSEKTHVILEEREGTKEWVTREMEECNWIHLACHGIQIPEDPTKSALLLQDGRLTLEQIIKLRLPKAEFAFLSACQTTAGDIRLSEESVHIAAGMQLAGYRSIVATMWSIRDDLAPEVADEFYRHILREGRRPDPREAAEALHLAVRKLRKKENVSFTAWIPYVHLGI